MKKILWKSKRPDGNFTTRSIGHEKESKECPRCARSYTPKRAGHWLCYTCFGSNGGVK